MLLVIGPLDGLGLVNAFGLRLFGITSLVERVLKVCWASRRSGLQGC